MECKTACHRQKEILCCMLKGYCNALWPQLLQNLQPIVSCADAYHCSTWSRRTYTGICRYLGQPAISADTSWHRLAALHLAMFLTQE